jgi:hypothetical protein
MAFGRSWYYPVDPELKMIHAFANCSGLRFPKKYSYMRTFILPPDDREEALKLDALVTKENYKICHACYSREVVFARQEKRKPRPGFGSAPPGYRPPQPSRPRGRTRKPKERDLN